MQNGLRVSKGANRIQFPQKKSFLRVLHHGIFRIHHTLPEKIEGSAEVLDLGFPGGGAQNKVDNNEVDSVFKASMAD